MITTMVAVSVWFVLLCALMVSLALVWLNQRGASAVAGAAAIFAIGLGIGAFQFMEFRSASLLARLPGVWGVSVLLPSAAVCAGSRLHAFRARPWLLMLAGPLVFLAAMI